MHQLEPDIVIHTHSECRDTASRSEQRRHNSWTSQGRAAMTRSIMVGRQNDRATNLDVQEASSRCVAPIVCHAAAGAAAAAAAVVVVRVAVQVA